MSKAYPHRGNPNTLVGQEACFFVAYPGKMWLMSNLDTMDTLAEAIRRSGGVRRLASEIGVKPINIYQWRLRKSVPAGWAAFLKESWLTRGGHARQPAPSMTAEAA